MGQQKRVSFFQGIQASKRIQMASEQGWPEPYKCIILNRTFVGFNVATLFVHIIRV